VLKFSVINSYLVLALVCFRGFVWNLLGPLNRREFTLTDSCRCRVIERSGDRLLRYDGSGFRALKGSLVGPTRCFNGQKKPRGGGWLAGNYAR